MPEDPQQQTPAPAQEPTPQVAPAPAPQPEPQPRYVPAERFEAVVAQKFEAIRQAEEAKSRAIELERQLREASRPSMPQAQYPTPPAPGVPPAWQPPANAPQITQADIDRLSNQKAAEMRFNERCNESVFAGRKVFGDVDAKITALKSVAPGLDANGQPMLPRGFVEAALETGKAEYVLYALANDLGEADRIMTLAPMRQAVELARLADKVAPASAPQDVVGDAERVAAQARSRPIGQVVGVSHGPTQRELAIDDPNLPMEEFMKRRNETAWDSRFSRNGRGRN
jgi:hypothetical protein